MSEPRQCDLTRLRLCVRGAVQGVGFRPFVHRLATALGLRGWVNNSPQGVWIEVEGSRATLEAFLVRIEVEKPPHSFIQSLEASWLDPVGYADFQIRESDPGGEKTVLVLPDIATCPECVREIFDPANRRHRYPFTNCTHCGPRFSIIEALPYDRARTTMKGFAMCPQCQAEYDEPRDRRFHAQPNACPTCGPRLELWDARGRSLQVGDAALRAAAQAIRAGQIVAVKGIGGFHLMVDARNDAAVRQLRERKHREEKPFALLFPTLESVRVVCEVSPLEERLLRSPEAPIVLLRRRAACPADENRRGIKSGDPAAAGVFHRVSDSVAPGNPNLGVMLPSNPLHHLLMADLGFPVVATSGNLSDEPICTDEREALERLGGVADLFLVHNRPIARHVDDSIVRVVLGRELVLRRARGYAPLPVLLTGGRGAHSEGSRLAATRPLAPPTSPGEGERSPAEGEDVPAATILAVGAHLKNTVALALGQQVFLSQHIGDLETEPAHRAFRRVVADLPKLYGVAPDTVAADLHPDYISTQLARQLSAGEREANEWAGHPRLIGVQHHIAHVLACMAENELKPPVLGVAWDGTGYGLDGTIWGGEFFRVSAGRVERVAGWRSFPLPGGDAAAREPRRAALGVLFEMFGEGAFERAALPTLGAFSPAELTALKSALVRGVNCPRCCSVGRLFDAVASLAGLRQRMRFEGQAAMELEFALEGAETGEAYPVDIRAETTADVDKTATHNRQPEILLDWSPMIAAILADVARGARIGEISAKFHNALVGSIQTVAQRVGAGRVALSGGCFQNRHLTERAVAALRAAGVQAYWHQRVPPNDGGIALGQVVAARWFEPAKHI
ncbi:MAG: carbamoyltransferase HypF [Verrucomicrobiae bacterium]|nr:carbamoyltransferase HypF [Verrucomicrobiae bacterium]